MEVLVQLCAAERMRLDVIEALLSDTTLATTKKRELVRSVVGPSTQPTRTLFIDILGALLQIVRHALSKIERVTDIEMFQD